MLVLAWTLELFLFHYYTLISILLCVVTDYDLYTAYFVNILFFCVFFLSHLCMPDEQLIRAGRIRRCCGKFLVVSLNELSCLILCGLLLGIKITGGDMRRRNLQLCRGKRVSLFQEAPSLALLT